MARITKIYNEGRKSPFQVLWRDRGKRYSRFFATEADRDKFIEMNTFLENDQFAVLFNLSKDEITDVAKIKLLKGELTYREIWQFWAKHHRAQEMITCWNACNSYIIDLRREGRSERHVVRVRRILELFCETFGEVYLESITRKELENWIATLPYAGQTKQNYKSIIRTVWSFFEKNEWITHNVAVRLVSEKIIKGEIGILTVEETEKLLRANENVDPEIYGLMALGLFAGMRSSAIARVDYDELNFKERGIETPAHKTKKNRRQFIENLPDNLWAWLGRTPANEFKMTERNFKKRRENAYRRAGLIITAEDVKRLAKDKIYVQTKFPPHNAFRHSFVSYHVALHRNFTDTALIIFHRHTDVLFEHYLGVAKKEDAERYFNIYPSDYKRNANRSSEARITS